MSVSDWLWVGVVVSGILMILIFYGYVLGQLLKRVYPWIVFGVVSWYIVRHAAKTKSRMEATAEALQEVERILRGEGHEDSGSTGS